MESNELENGRFVMKSMDIKSHGEEGINNG
jgi:hypothetical protein